MLRVLLAVSLALAPSAAWATPETAQVASQARQAGDLAGARTLFERALEEGGNDPPWLRAIYLELGLLRAASGDARGAESAFSALLSLSPDVTLPPGAPPPAAAAFERARAARGVVPPLGLEVTAQDPTEAGQAHWATVHVKNDTADLFRGARAVIVVGPSSGTTAEASGRSPLRIVFPREATRTPGDLRYRIEALDARGSVLATDGTDAQPRVVEVVARETLAAVVLTPDEAAPSGVWSSPWLWTGVGAVVVGAVAVGIWAASAGGSGVGRVGPPEIRTP